MGTTRCKVPFALSSRRRRPVARELGLGEQRLGRWAAQQLLTQLEAPEDFAGAETEKSELERLRRGERAVADGFLGRAAAVFTSKQQIRNA